MPENQPQPPEGCEFMWWSNKRKAWLYKTKDYNPFDGHVLQHVPGAKGFSDWVSRDDLDPVEELTAELLRVATERDELRAEVEKKDRFIERWKVEVDDLQAEIERLKKFEPKAKVIDCSKGQHDWKRVAGTDSISECQVCGRQSGK